MRTLSGQPVADSCTQTRRSTRSIKLNANPALRHVEVQCGTATDTALDDGSSATSVGGGGGMDSRATSIADASVEYAQGTGGGTAQSDDGGAEEEGEQEVQIASLGEALLAGDIRLPAELLSLQPGAASAGAGAGAGAGAAAGAGVGAAVGMGGAAAPARARRGRRSSLAPQFSYVR